MTLTDISRHGMETPPGDGRLGEAILYVAERLADDPAGQGAVKLNKILWWADFESFRERGRSVTGAVYQKLAEGPAPVRLLPARKRLEMSGAAEMTERHTGARSPEKILQALRAPEPVFDDVDVRYLERALKKFHGMTGKECSDFSHRASAGWQTVKQGQIIPYETSIIDTRPPSEAHLAWARSVAVEAGHIPA